MWLRNPTLRQPPNPIMSSMRSGFLCRPQRKGGGCLNHETDYRSHLAFSVFFAAGRNCGRPAFAETFLFGILPRRSRSNRSALSIGLLRPPQESRRICAKREPIAFTVSSSTNAMGISSINELLMTSRALSLSASSQNTITQRQSAWLSFCMVQTRSE